MNGFPRASLRYSLPAIVLHWLVALFIFSAIGLGVYMINLSLSPTKLKLYSFHKWIGVSIFLLMLVRLAWRITHRPPQLPAQMSAAMCRAAEAMHAALYLLVLAIPISGWLMSSAKGFQTVWFGVIPLPDLIAKDVELGKSLAIVHQTLNIGLGLLLLTHIGAALKHRYIDRDDILARMLPAGSRMAVRNKPGTNPNLQGATE